MQQNYTDIADYFEQLADKHKQIKTFCRYELDELLSKTASIKAFPCLVVEGFDFDFAGSSPDNILKNRHGAFQLSINATFSIRQSGVRHLSGPKLLQDRSCPKWLMINGSDFH